MDLAMRLFCSPMPVAAPAISISLHADWRLLDFKSLQSTCVG
jgi:hypothetical protein